MNKTAIKNFAVWARNKLIEEITYKAGLLGITGSGIAAELPASTDTLKLYDIGTKEPVKVEGIAVSQRNSLVTVINRKAEKLKYKDAFEYVIEEVAYTWFNRLIAVRFIEVNDYLPSGVRVLSSEKAGKNEPDMVTSPFDTDINFTANDRGYIETLKDDELFRFLFIKQCNKLNEILPELFEKTDNYTEILLTLSFTDTDSVVYHLVHDIPEEDFNVKEQGQIQIIGWLYQYYNSEPKDEVFKNLKKNVKISKENIPAATQLFTPDWIVKYMVENSLGRLWLEYGSAGMSCGNADDALLELWSYYIEEAEQEENVETQIAALRAEYRIASPEEIKVLDPCMGSGHILVYAFDVLMQIYVSQGYTERDAAAKIIRNNLYGLDIDKRAYQLAYFALMMKAREYDRRFLTRKIQPNLSHLQGLDGVQNASVGGVLKEFAAQFKDCENYGSLMEISEVKGLDDALDEFSGVFEMNFEQTEQMMRIYTALSQKYDVVCTNPPYMGGSGMNSDLTNFVKKTYPDSKSDLFAVFIERCGNLIKPRGYYGMITQHAWMFLSSYEKLRAKLLMKTTVNMAHLGARAFDEIGGEVVQTTVFVNCNARITDYKGVYVRLVDINGENEKRDVFLSGENRYTAIQENFSKIPGAPVAYWVRESVFNAYQAPNLDQIAKPRHGLATSDNDRFLKLWYEVNINKTSLFQRCDYDKKWFPMNKGGSFRKWYGNLEWVINYENDGKELKDFAISIYKCSTRTIQNTQFYFQKSITWSAITSGKFSVRWSDKGALFGSGGYCAFTNDDIEQYIIALLNNKVSSLFLSLVSPTLNYEVGHIKTVPVIVSDEETKKIINGFVKENISISKADWDSFETSWDFKHHPLI